MVVLYFSCNFDVVVRGDEPCLPTPLSWPEVPALFLEEAVLFPLYVHGILVKDQLIINVWVYSWLSILLH